MREQLQTLHVNWAASPLVIKDVPAYVQNWVVSPLVNKNASAYIQTLAVSTHVIKDVPARSRGGGRNPYH
jgi:hypothetical protein